MNKSQREKLSELETQLWHLINGFRVLLDEYQTCLVTPYDSKNNNWEEVRELVSIISCLNSAIDNILGLKGMVDSMPKEGGEKCQKMNPNV